MIILHHVVPYNCMRNFTRIPNLLSESSELPSHPRSFLLCHDTRYFQTNIRNGICASNSTRKWLSRRSGACSAAEEWVRTIFLRIFRKSEILNFRFIALLCDAQLHKSILWCTLPSQSLQGILVNKLCIKCTFVAPLPSKISHCRLFFKLSAQLQANCFHISLPVENASVTRR